MTPTPPRVDAQERRAADLGGSVLVDLLHDQAVAYIEAEHPLPEPPVTEWEGDRARWQDDEARVQELRDAAYNAFIQAALDAIESALAGVRAHYARDLVGDLREELAGACIVQTDGDGAQLRSTWRRPGLLELNRMTAVIADVVRRPRDAR